MNTNIDMTELRGPTFQVEIKNVTYYPGKYKNNHYIIACTEVRSEFSNQEKLIKFKYFGLSNDIFSHTGLFLIKTRVGQPITEQYKRSDIYVFEALSVNV